MPSLSRSPRLLGFCVFLALSALSASDSALGATTVETVHVKVLRVTFEEAPEEPTYDTQEVKGLLGKIEDLWWKNSYHRLKIDFEVTELYQIPGVRDDYFSGQLTAAPTGFDDVLQAAVNGAEGVTWTDTTAVLVVVAQAHETTPSYRGQGVNECTLFFPGQGNTTVGCAVVGENPGENKVWGRWAHELGHAFQRYGPWHPSDYKSEFELMDSNYPGQSGVFEKQPHTGFPGWLPNYKFITFDPTSGGGTAAIWASEYKPSIKVNPQAVKVEITDSLYYLVSVRRRILGDELNADYSSPSGIPDEGVLIERVEVPLDEDPNVPWVKVIGPGKDKSCNPDDCNRDDLWKQGGEFDSEEGVRIQIAKEATADDYVVHVAYDDQAFVPDVMLYPWRSPPGNTWETTDIWIDSKVNGWDEYRYGKWNDLEGQPVPKGNGDDPAVGQANRVYARVRNVGHAPATNVRVVWEVTDPLGVGINGASGWEIIGAVDKEDFPELANILPGSYVDVYTEWIPTVPPEEIAAGSFYFHTCIRVTLNRLHLAGETVFGNQDGRGEQENIDYFQATVVAQAQAVKKRYYYVFLLRNDAPRKKQFLLSYKTDLPPGWQVTLNKNQRVVELGPNEVRGIPLSIVPGRYPLDIGSVFWTDVSASYPRLLVNDRDKKDTHIEYTQLGGLRVETRILKETSVDCKVVRSRWRGYLVTGVLRGTKRYYPTRARPLKVMVVGADRVRGGYRLRPDVSTLARVAPNGIFRANVKHRRRSKRPSTFVCMFAGTDRLASSASDYVRVR